jgi:flavin reductase (DIM6/NTAB) family NADH-FMN oxidoreductase RutF
VHVFELGLHAQFVGEIVDVKADEAILDANGMPDAEKLKPIIYATGTQRWDGIGPCLEQAFSIG